MRVSSAVQKGRTKRQSTAPAPLASNTLKRIGNELRHATEALSRAADTLEAPPGWLYARRTKRPNLPAGRLDGIEETGVAITLRRLRAEGQDTRLLEGMLLRSVAPLLTSIAAELSRSSGSVALDDLVQEANTSLLFRLEEYDPERHPFAIWAKQRGRDAMVRLIHRQAQDIHVSDWTRQRGKHRVSSETASALDSMPGRAVAAHVAENIRAGDDPEAETSEHEQRMLLARTLAKLPRLQREVVSRSHGLGKRQKQSTQEIAAALKVKPGEVRTALELGMRALRARMG